MISLVDPADLETVLRPTVYQPSDARDLTVRGATSGIPRLRALPRDRPNDGTDEQRN
jgi:hypothetical protein